MITKKTGPLFCFSVLFSFVSCKTSHPKMLISPNKYGISGLEIRMSNPVHSPELIFDGYSQWYKKGKRSNFIFEEFPAGKHFLRIRSTSWDTTINFNALPKECLILNIDSPQ